MLQTELPASALRSLVKPEVRLDGYSKQTEIVFPNNVSPDILLSLKQPVLLTADSSAVSSIGLTKCVL
jgi:hypothetical protein